MAENMAEQHGGTKWRNICFGKFVETFVFKPVQLLQLSYPSRAWNLH